MYLPTSLKAVRGTSRLDDEEEEEEELEDDYEVVYDDNGNPVPNPTLARSRIYKREQKLKAAAHHQNTSGGLWHDLKASLDPDESAYFRVLRVCRWLIYMSTFQVAVSLGMMTIAIYLEASNHENASFSSDFFQNFMSSLVAAITGGIGMFAGMRQAEFFARLFFVCQFWLLSNLTFYFFWAVNDVNTLTSLCAPVQGSYSSSVTRCGSIFPPYTAKLTLICFALVFCVLSTILAKDMDDAVNDFIALRTHEQAQTDFAGFGVYAVHARPVFLSKEDAKSWHLIYGVHTQEVLLDSKDFTAKHHKKGQVRLVFKDEDNFTKV
eukprot:PhF_6_TR28159/c0_g1_i1/m.41713